MKKFIKNNIFGFLIGIILCSGVVYGTSSYESNNIKYSPTDSSWNVNNVNEAINSLYSMKTELDNIKGIGDATAANILKGKKAVVKGNTVTGTMNDFSNIGRWINTDTGAFYNNQEYTYRSGVKVNDMVMFKYNETYGYGYMTPTTKFIIGRSSDLAPLIKSGATLLGVTGTYTSDATATAADIASGKTAYVNGTKITGTAENKIYSNNWTMVVSFDISLGWNGNTGYGSQKGRLTIKSVDGNVSITQSGGAISSPSDKWNGTYYINSSTSNFKIESFTLD